MASNFDFLKKIDEELFSIVEDGERLFRDEYFNQSIVQFRIYAEKMAKNILDADSSEMTFDTVLNNLKDKIKTEREKEFIEDLFFIKKEGNACAHGEDSSAITCLEVIRRAFEAGINYAWAKKKDEKIDKLVFDETLLIAQKKASEEKLIDKYLKAAQSATDEITKENILNKKQGEFLSSVEKGVDENDFKDRNYVQNTSQYTKTAKKGRKKKELTPVQIKVKEKVKEAKKNLKENVNYKERKKTSKPKQKTKNKTTKSKKTKKINNIKNIVFILFVLISIFFILKMTLILDFGNFFLKKYFI